MAKKKSDTRRKGGPKPLVYDCLRVKQDPHHLVLFSAPASELHEVMAVNMRDPDNDTGYQRVCSASRLKSIAGYINRKKPLPLSLLVSLEADARVNTSGTKITIPRRKGAGWLIDGQHRLGGAAKADRRIELPVVAFLGLSDREQSEQFVTINKEQKGVPTSLRYDLLKHMTSPKSETEIAKERATEIAHQLRKDPDSPFADRIPIVRAPKRGEISLTNFVRRIYPLVHASHKAGVLHYYDPSTQEACIDNYYRAFKIVFPKPFEPFDSVFYRTIGFGAVFASFSKIFHYVIQSGSGGFRVRDIVPVLRKVDYFDFDAWKQFGTGSAAENNASSDLLSELDDRIGESGGKTLIVTDDQD